MLSCYRDKDQVLEEIGSRAADPDVDAVILVPHWGAEDHHQVIGRQKALAHAALEAGAAAVIGSHPHVLQGWEKYETEAGEEGLIVYSTGNFISNQRKLMQRAGIIALVELVREEKGKARVAAAGYVPTWVVIDGNVNHRVTVNEGKSGWTRGALQKTHQLLPMGNHLEFRDGIGRRFSRGSAPPRSNSTAERKTLLCKGDVDCLAAATARIGLGFEGHALAVVKRWQTGLFKRRDVDKDVLAAVIRRYEAEAPRMVEKLYCTGLAHHLLL